MNKSLFVIATILTATAVLPVATFASGNVTPTPTNTPTPTATPTPTSTQNCNPTYGQGGTCETTVITLDKKVQHPTNGTYVDNLGVNDPKYSPNQTVNFTLTVTNTGTASISAVTVKDTLPSYVTYVSGGSYNSDTRTVTYTINGMQPGASQTVNLATKVVNDTDLPNDQGITCVTNQAQAILDDKTASDNAQFCIQKSVLGTTPAPTGTSTTTTGGNVVYPVPTNVKTTPSTGPEALALLGLIPSGLTGLLLRRKMK